MPEWHDPTIWTRMGLWDLIPQGDALRREIYPPMLDALRAAQRLDRKFAEFRAGSAEAFIPADRAEPSGETISFRPDPRDHRR
jgi:hypothetical protein